ncbi:hypothetical protein BDZ97DRAFT_2074453 [Flammula alnicola]|nr:hypothetical protein BDZ97DRAFT_2074453 [Flammula alnicola]
MSLPPELLKIIFEYVQLPFLNIRRRISEIDPTSPEFEFLVGRVTASTSFPYLHAGVCQYWRDVLLFVPTFWTTAVVFVGSPTISVKDAAPRVFELSRNHPIDVAIRLAPNAPQHVAQDLLQEEVQYVLEELNPHLHRCQSLYIGTDLVSSVSLPYRHLRGETAILKTLMVKSERSRITEKRPQDSVAQHTSLPDLFRPDLEHLLLDDANFQHACQHPETLLANPNLKSLAITNYTQGERHEAVRVAQVEVVSALWAMPNLRSLKLQDVDLVPLSDTEVLELGIEEIFMEDMDSEVLGKFFKYTYLPELRQLRFRACWVEEDCVDLPSECGRLILQDISGDEVLCPVLSRWEGESLTVFDCQAFDDRVLEMFSRPVNPDIPEDEVTAGTRFGCQELCSLTIIGDSGISIAGLKNMVESRNRWLPYENPEWRTSPVAGPAIVRLHIKEFRADATLSPEDVEWFGEHVADFTCPSLQSEVRKLMEFV